MKDNVRFQVSILNRQVTNVAFYDRASTPEQATNHIRSWYCTEAVKIAAEKGWRIIASGDHRNNGICFLDCGTGMRWDNRPNLMRALSDVRVDTIVAVSHDRFDRDPNCLEELKRRIDERKKNLIFLLSESDVKFEDDLRHVLQRLS